MERFLERVSISPYRNNFILKGGMLVALPLNEEDAVRIVNEIICIHVEDGISFVIVKAAEIMTDFEYPGVRLVLEARLDRLKQRIKIDLSTDDVITPAAIRYSYRLMFEERSIELMTYTPETLLCGRYKMDCSLRSCMRLHKE